MLNICENLKKKNLINLNHYVVIKPYGSLMKLLFKTILKFQILVVKILFDN